MKKPIAVILLTLTTLLIGAQAQTATNEHKPAAKQSIPVAPPAVSDAFAKTALHLLLAVRNSDGSDVAAGHIETLFEDLEIETNTATEELLRQRFAVIDTFHRFYLEHQESTELRHNAGCLNKYIDLLKTKNSKTVFTAVPSECDSTLAGVK